METIPLQIDIIRCIIDDDILSIKCKQLILYYASNDLKHSIINLTFKELLHVVWTCILEHEHKNDIKQVLNQEIVDSENKCYTGRLGRLINCLNGYDERVIIKISDNEQIGQVISAVYTRLMNNEDEEYSITKHKDIARQELLDMGYIIDTIETWLGHL
jgi:hypothetical protein